jgi:hypothetical protein
MYRTYRCSRTRRRTATRCGWAVAISLLAVPFAGAGLSLAGGGSPGHGSALPLETGLSPSSTLAWSQVLSPSSPSPRYWGAMAYDPADGYEVLFGGLSAEDLAVSLEDTWTYADGVWTNITSTASPGPDLYSTSGVSMTYDPTDREVLLVGPSATNITEEQTWAFQSGRWTQLHPEAEPTARSFAAFAYDAGGDYALLYGGLSLLATGPHYLSDTWSFSGGNWSMLYPSTGIGANETAQTMAYDASDGYLVLVTYAPNNPGVQVPETWTFQGGAWQNTGQAGPLPLDLGNQIAYDPTLASIVAVDAVSVTNQTTDLWQFQGGHWTNSFVPGTFELTGLSSLTFDAAVGSAMFLGVGSNFNASGPSDLTELWQLAPVAIDPPPVVSISASPADPSVGGAVTIQGTAVGAYGYVWSELSLTVPGCPAVTNNASVRCTPSKSGTYDAVWSIRDQAGRTASGSLTITVASYPTVDLVVAGAVVGAGIVVLAVVWVRRRRSRGQRTPDASGQPVPDSPTPAGPPVQ